MRRPSIGEGCDVSGVSSQPLRGLLRSLHGGPLLGVRRWARRWLACSQEKACMTAEVPDRSVFLVGMPTHGREGLEACLKRSGVLSEHFSGVEPCREALGERLCDLIVISLDGDVVSGLQLLGNLEPPVDRIPKLVLVEHGDIPTTIQSIRAGAANCLEKPLDDQRLCSEIRTLLDQITARSLHSTHDLTQMQKTVLQHVLDGKTTGRDRLHSPPLTQDHRSTPSTRYAEARSLQHRGPDKNSDLNGTLQSVT